MKVRIYIEGGGEGKELDEVFRRAWKRFFEAAGVRRKPRVIRGGGRQHTFDAFRNRVVRDAPDETSLLLPTGIRSICTRPARRDGSPRTWFVA